MSALSLVPIESLCERADGDTRGSKGNISVSQQTLSECLCCQSLCWAHELVLSSSHSLGTVYASDTSWHRCTVTNKRDGSLAFHGLTFYQDILSYHNES